MANKMLDLLSEKGNSAITGEKFDVIDKLLQKFPLLAAAAKKNTSFALAVAHAAELVAKVGKFTDALGAQIINKNLQLTTAMQNKKLKAEFFKFLQAVISEKIGTIIATSPNDSTPAPNEETEVEEEEEPTPDIVLEIMTLLNDIPLARMGDIITSEHHNSLRRAINALARGIGDSTQKLILNLAPNFLPVNQRLPQQFDWKVTFNKALVPSEEQGPSQKDDIVRGAFAVPLPNNARLQKMIIRGKRIGDEENPAEFKVTLNRLEFGKPLTDANVIIEFDLKTFVGDINETENAKSVSLGIVNNTKYHYFILANWKNAGNSDRFEINSFQIFGDS